MLNDMNTLHDVTQIKFTNLWASWKCDGMILS